MHFYDIAKNIAYSLIASVESTKDLLASKECPGPMLACGKIWHAFDQQLLIYVFKGESRQGQGHSSSSSVKVTELLNQHYVC